MHREQCHEKPSLLQFGKSRFVRAEHLRLRSEFDHMRENGRSFAGKAMVLVVSRNTLGMPRCGIICGRKFSLKAPSRNRAKRLLRESFRLIKSNIDAADIVLIAKKRIFDFKAYEIQSDLINLLQKAHLWKGKTE